VLEQLTLFNLEGAVQNESYKEEIPASLLDSSLPWINPAILTQKFKIGSASDDKSQKQEYQIYLGTFSSSSVTDFIKLLPKQAKVGFQDDVSPKPNRSCYASIKIDSNGLLVAESLQCAAAPWALNEIGEILAGRKQSNIATWTENFDHHVNKLQELFRNRAAAFAESEHKVTVADLQQLLNEFVKDLWCPNELSLGYYVIKATSGKSDDGASDIINSYFLDELARSAAAVKSGLGSPALEQYLTQTIAGKDRTNVEQIPFLQYWLSPKHLTLGRWASNPTQNLSLMQQLAVNLAIAKLSQQDGLFSVNGPPGTGKTTLLRDLVADLVVRRAEKMVAFADPVNAFTKKGDFYRPHSSLTGFEIVVASSNNAAVENVTVELPAIGAIHDSYQGRATYLRTVAESVKAGVDKKKSKNVNDSKSQSAPPAPDAESPTVATWGLIAATLGKKSNCSDFCEGFWWDKDGSIKAVLKHTPEIQQWLDARKEFDRCKKAVQTLIDRRETWYQQIDRAPTSPESIVAKASLGASCGDRDWWNRPNDELQLSAPWIDRELNCARTDLFLAALNVHEQFIRQAATPFKKNLGRWVDLVKGDQKKLDDEQILHLWQTFFLVVPVISTTFASMRRLLGRLPTASLGWLLIDEAGQAIPQAAVGALQRTKRAVIVGDPLQIEPVFTQDAELVKDLQTHFGIDDCWSPTEASIQTLCDQSNSLGTEIEVNNEPMWIGCPLWVHRRCIEPMATISNKIAYENKMVVATYQSNIERQFPLGQSQWIDVEGKCQGKHWVEAQGGKVLEMLTKLVKAEAALPSLYMISPFKIVSLKLKKLLKDKQSLWAIGLTNLDIDRWIDDSVGTVHTFQGKEADAVIFILGGDSNSRGALDWASSKPNILNVAITRAKYRLYVIGDRQLWKKLKYFNEASDLLPVLIESPLDRDSSSFSSNIKLENIPAKSAIDYFNDGHTKYNLKDYQGAIDDCTKAIELDPDNASHYSNRGLSKYNLKDYQGAIDDHTQAINLNPDNATYYNRRGNAKSNFKDYQGAVADYTQAIELDPDNATYYRNRGHAKCNLKDYQGAVADYTEAIELDPDNANYYRNRGFAKYNLKDYQGDIDDCTKAIELDPDNASDYNNRGVSKYTLGDYQGATSDLERSIELDPQHPNSYFWRGCVRHTQHDYENAIFDYNRAIELDPRYANAYINRCVSKYKSQDYQGSISDFIQAIILNPSGSITTNIEEIEKIIDETKNRLL
jgi:tetratricopeptide (TPR) repeat protein